MVHGIMNRNFVLNLVSNSIIDEGEGEVVVCLHGEPTWGYLYRNMIDPLAEEFRVVVPDHMGFGKNETPQDRDYTLKAILSEPPN